MANGRRRVSDTLEAFVGILSPHWGAVRHKRISMHTDPPGRTHHAIIFDIDEHPKNATDHGYTAHCHLWEWMTWTKHRTISNWDFATSKESDQISEKELALLVPRSFWVWHVPGFLVALPPLRWLIPEETKDLFYLESGVD